MKSLMLRLVAAILAVTALCAPATLLADQSGTITQPACNATQASPGSTLPGCTSGTQLDKKTGTDAAPVAPYLTTLVNTFIYAAGAVALIFLIIGGVRYITSSGNATQIQQAKDTITYSIVGLIVVILARLIVGFIIQKVS